MTVTGGGPWQVLSQNSKYSSYCWSYTKPCFPTANTDFTSIRRIILPQSLARSILIIRLSSDNPETYVGLVLPYLIQRGCIQQHAEIKVVGGNQNSSIVDKASLVGRPTFQMEKQGMTNHPFPYGAHSHAFWPSCWTQRLPLAVVIIWGCTSRRLARIKLCSSWLQIWKDHWTLEKAQVERYALNTLWHMLVRSLASNPPERQALVPHLSL